VDTAAPQLGEVGIDAHAYPLDTGRTMRLQRAFRSLPARHRLPAPLTVAEADSFVDRHRGCYGDF
jgi:hypothetical protein